MVEKQQDLISKTCRNISFSYRTALSVVAVMIVLVAFITGHLVKAQIDSYPIILMSAKQRMFSQRVAFLTGLLPQVSGSEREETVKKLVSSLNDMEVANERLTTESKLRHAAKPDEDELYDIYFSPPVNLDAQMRSYFEHAHHVLQLSPDKITLNQPDIAAMVAQARGPFIASIETAVDYYRRETAARLNRLHDLVLGLSALSLLILAAVAMLLMRPAVAYIAQAQKRLQELNRLKGDFLANMSHEIRTPMNGIFGMAELLIDSGLTERQLHYASTLQHSADHLLGLINDILDFSKLESGHMKLDPIHFNLLATIEDVLELLSTRAREKNLELLLHYMPGTPRFAVADPGRIRQVLFNLIGNAIKFTDRGYVIVHAEMYHPPKATDKKMWLRIRVEDTGIGIPEEKQSLLFEKFMQVESGSTRARQGTGLGLEISRSLINLMGGKIAVQSTHGVGSTFTLEIPLQEGSEPQTDIPRAANLAGKRVLLVDDLAPNRLYFREALIAAGLECLTAENAKEAFSILCYERDNKRSVDVVLTDFMMPGMDGLQLTRALKQDERFRAIPVMVLTSVTGQGMLDMFSEVGASACLDKPISRQQLMDALSHILDAAEKGKKLDIITAKSSTAMTAQKFLVNDKSLAGTNILLVEDNRVNLEITTEILTHFGCNVVTAENGKQAVEAACNYQFDLILMDCQMPEMDGFEAAEHIVSLKAAGKIGPVPIVALTANALKGDRERCLESGMDDYLSKPVRRANLQAILLKWLREKIRKSDEAAATQAAPSASVDVVPAVATNVLPMPRRPGAVDALIFAETRSNLGNKLGTVLGYYIHDAEMYMDQITNALQRQDAHGVLQSAHTLKSSSRQFGAMELAEIAERIETIARAKGDDKDIAAIAAMVLPMRAAYDQVRPYFMSMIDEEAARPIV